MTAGPLIRRLKLGTFYSDFRVENMTLSISEKGSIISPLPQRRLGTALVVSSAFAGNPEREESLACCLSGPHGPL